MGLGNRYGVLVMTHYSRGMGAAGILLGDFNGYLVTDHYAGYNRVDAKRRQLCWAHLTRHFIAMSERGGQAAIDSPWCDTHPASLPGR